MRSIRTLGLLTAIVLLAGCGSSAPNTYYWDNYQQTVYQYYKQDSNVEEQIAKLNLVIEKARAKGLAVPPGLYAHMGMLYSNAGQLDQAHASFNQEKELFPESAIFMNFLMKNKAGK